MAQPYRRGQMWWYHPGDEPNLPRHAQRGTRPVIIITDDHINDTSTCLLVVSCTSQVTRNFPTHHIFLAPNGKINVARCEQIHRVDISQLDGFVGNIEPYVMEFIDTCCKRALGFVSAYPDGKPVPEVVVTPEKSVADTSVVASQVVSPQIQNNTNHPASPQPSKSTTPLIDNNGGKRRVWDDVAKSELVTSVEVMGVLHTAKKYNLTSQTVQNYANRFARELNGTC